MSITIKPMEESADSKTENAIFDPRVYDMVMQAIQKDATNIVQNALLQGVELSNAMINDVKKELHSISKAAASSKVVMAVQINESEIKKLSTEAVPYLGRLIINAKIGVNSLLIGPAGCGKTHSAKQLAEALGLQFGHLNLTAGASETWLFGRQTPNGFIEGTFSSLYKNGGVFLADEIDAADANLMLSINTAIAGNSLYNPICGETIPRHKDFVFIVAANTFGKGADAVYTGRSRLDAATLDRFVMIAVNYNTNIEEKLCPNVELRNVLWKIREQLLELGAKDFISTRAMQIAQLQLDGGVSVPDILDSITLSWPEDIRDDIKEKVREFKNSGDASDPEVIKSGRGRPKGSKNKQKDEIPF